MTYWNDKYFVRTTNLTSIENMLRYSLLDYNDEIEKYTTKYITLQNHNAYIPLRTVLI